MCACKGRCRESQRAEGRLWPLCLHRLVLAQSNSKGFENKLKPDR